MQTRTVVVVPCYNEAERLRPELFTELAARDGFGVLFVDDGSTDATASVLDDVCARAPERFATHRLAANAGKAEAVRSGLNQAIAMGAQEVGYLDADGATLPVEMARLRAELDDGSRQVALGSRVRLLGRQVQRRATRHYIGRLFATYVSLIVLRMPVYDTQCGAKLFRVSPKLRDALAKPFATRWTFDVELLQRLMHGDAAVSAKDLVEVPLSRWIDVRGSKLRAFHALGIARDLLRLTLYGLRRG